MDDSTTNDASGTIDDVVDDVDDDHDYSIEQIMPASEGWVTLWNEGELRPVACLALIECSIHGNRFVAPMVAEEGELVDATQLEGYIGVVHEDDILDGPDDCDCDCGDDCDCANTDTH